MLWEAVIISDKSLQDMETGRKWVDRQTTIKFVFGQRENGVGEE